MYPFNIRGVYNFSVHPSAILGSDFNNVTILGILDYETALQTVDIPAIHTSVFPYLPSGIPDDPSQYDYVRIRTASGVATIIGIPWIDLDTLVEVESRRATVVIEGVSNSDVERIRLALVSNGFNTLNITLN